MFPELDFCDKIEVRREMACSRAEGGSIQVRFSTPNESLFSQTPRDRLPRAARSSLESSGWEAIQQSRCQACRNTEWGCRGNLRRSFTPSRPTNTNEILEEILTPLRVLDDREASEVQGRLALINFRSDLSSFERGGRYV